MESSESLSTREFAELVRVESQTIRRGYCVNGHYLNIRPIKLPNRRLLWAREEVMSVIEGSGRHTRMTE